MKREELRAVAHRIKRRLVREGDNWETSSLCKEVDELAGLALRATDRGPEMKVKHLREYLAPFPADAKVLVVVDNYPRSFEVTYGGADGCTEGTAAEISFMVNVNAGESQEEQP